MRILLLAALPLPAAFAATPYSASDLGGSPIPVGAGTRALAMGGAFVAIADDASAATWNPAGMTQLERPEASASAGFYWRRTSSDGDSRRSSRADLDHVSAVMPFFIGVQQTVGVEWQRQFDFGKAQSFAQDELVDLGGGFHQANTSDYALDQHGSFASLGASYAIEPVNGLSFGATINAWNDGLTGRSRYDKGFSSRAEQVFTDNTGAVIGDTVLRDDIDERVRVERGYNAVIGALWQVDAALTVGANWKPGYLLHLAHAVSDRQVSTDVLAGTSTETDASASFANELRMPTSAALGAAWRFDDSRTVSADLTWTRWRQYRLITGGVATSPVNSFIPPDDYPDGYALRVGYEHILILPRLVVVPRIGALYEEVPGSTAAPSTLQPQLAGAKLDRYYGVTAGLGVFQSRVLYEVAGEFRWTNHAAGSLSPDQESRVRSFATRAGLAFQF